MHIMQYYCTLNSLMAADRKTFLHSVLHLAEGALSKHQGMEWVGGAFPLNKFINPVLVCCAGALPPAHHTKEKSTGHHSLVEGAQKGFTDVKGLQPFYAFFV